MFKENLLESSEKIEIEILKKLYINNGVFSKHKLCEELKISFPTLKVYIKNINLMFLNHYNNDVHIYINNENILLKYINNISLDNFVSIYIENSLKYQLLCILYQNKNLTSFKLCDALNISLSTLNRKINECNKLLSSFDLTIKKFELIGSPLQIAYFYHSLFINVRTKKEDMQNFYDKEIVKFLEESSSIEFDYTQKLSLCVWSKIIIKQRYKFIKENFSDSFTKENLDKFKNDTIFKNLELFYSKFPDNKKYLAYATMCFLKTFGILEIENKINTTLPFDLHKFILLKMKSLFSNKDFEFDNVIKSNILSYCNKKFYFKGVFYSIDQNTKNFYLNNHLSFLKEQFILYLFKEIKSYFPLSNLNFKYFKLLMVLNLSYINEESKYTIKIGILSKTESSILKILLKDFNSILIKKFNVQTEIFSEKNLNEYDLIVSNIDDVLPCSISTKIFKFTYLGVKYDLYNLIKVLNNIEKEKLKILNFN